MILSAPPELAIQQLPAVQSPADAPGLGPRPVGCTGTGLAWPEHEGLAGVRIAGAAPRPSGGPAMGAAALTPVHKQSLAHGPASASHPAVHFPTLELWAHESIPYLPDLKHWFEASSADHTSSDFRLSWDQADTLGRIYFRMGHRATFLLQGLLATLCSCR